MRVKKSLHKCPFFRRNFPFKVQNFCRHSLTFNYSLYAALVNTGVLIRAAGFVWNCGGGLDSFYKDSLSHTT